MLLTYSGIKTEYKFKKESDQFSKKENQQFLLTPVENCRYIRKEIITIWQQIKSLKFVKTRFQKHF